MAANRHLSTLAAGLLVVAAFSPANQAQQTAKGDLFFNDYPESGRWFANDGSRTGFFIEIQDGVLAGLYVGADRDGNNVWLNFSGRLEPRFPDEERPDLQQGWQLSSQLVQITGGGCIIFCSQESEPDDLVVGSVGGIRFDFIGRNHAVFRIDENQPLTTSNESSNPGRVAPLYFGVAATAHDPDQPLAAMPDLEGGWVVARSESQSSSTGSSVIELGQRQVETPPTLAAPPPGYLKRIVRHPVIGDAEGLLPEDTTIRCDFFAAGREPRQQCGLEHSNDSMSVFEIDFNSISDTNFTVFQTFDTSDDVVRYKFFRLEYD